MRLLSMPSHVDVYSVDGEEAGDVLYVLLDVSDCVQKRS